MDFENKVGFFFYANGKSNEAALFFFPFILFQVSEVKGLKYYITDKVC